MRAFQFVKNLFAESPRHELVQILTPQIGHRSPLLRLGIAGATLAGLTIFGTIAVSALLTLLAAIGVIYFLVTQVLGIELDFDPETLMRRAQEYAGSAPN